MSLGQGRLHKQWHKKWNHKKIWHYDYIKILKFEKRNTHKKTILSQTKKNGQTICSDVTKETIQMAKLNIKKKDAAFQSNKELKIKTKKDTFLTH